MISNFEIMQHISNIANEVDKGVLTSTEGVEHVMDILNKERGEDQFLRRLGIQPAVAVVGESNVVVSCQACEKPTEVVIYAHRISTNEMKQVFVCKGHMLDPGPLLDW